MPTTIIVCEACYHTKSNHIGPNPKRIPIEAQGGYCVGSETCDCMEYI